MVKGVIELDSFNKSMVLTGNYSGQTRLSVEALANSLKDNAHGAIGKTTDMLYALIQSGKFSTETLGAVSAAALNFQTLTGQSTEQVAKMFEGLVKTHGKVYNDMTNHVAEWAAKENDQA